MKSQAHLNPFLSGRPVPPNRFIGRANEIYTLFSRIASSQSSAIVGEPHIGKTSLKRFIGDDQIRSEWLGEKTKNTIFVDSDCHLVPGDLTIGSFWQGVLAEVESKVDKSSLQASIRIASQSAMDHMVLQRLFLNLGNQGWRIVLLMDEFDSLIHHPQLGSNDFFAPLRSISNNTDGLVTVITSRLSLSELNRRAGAGRSGSPLFNHKIELKLPALSIVEVDELLDRALQGSGLELSAKDRSFINRVAGRHPFLLQAAGSALFDAALVGPQASGETRYKFAAERLCSQTEAHFADVWDHLNSRAQIAMAILALAENDGRMHKRDFDTGSLGQLDWYEPELRDLESRGLVECEGEMGWHADWGHFALWHGHRWRVSATSFVWWIANHAIPGTREMPGFEEWLRQIEIQGLLTRGEKEKIKELASKIPKGVRDTAGELMGKTLKGYLGA
jgi:hypothetical protein